jgi:hypothetical protein
MCFHNGCVEGPKTTLSGFDMPLDACRAVLRRTDLDRKYPDAIFALVDDSKRAGHPKHLVAAWRKKGEMLLRVPLKDGVIVNLLKKADTPPEPPVQRTNKVLYRGCKLKGV